MRKRARQATRRSKRKAPPRRRRASSAITERAAQAAANVGAAGLPPEGEPWGRRFEAARHLTDALFPLPPREIRPLELPAASARRAYTRPWGER